MAEILRSGLQRGEEGAAHGRPCAWHDRRPDDAPYRHAAGARIVLPPIGNQMIGMLKLSALVSVVAVEELLLVANQTASADFRYFEALTAAGIYYLAMTTIFMGVQVLIETVFDPKKRAAYAPDDVDRADARDIAIVRRPMRRQRAMEHLLEIVGINKNFGAAQVLKSCSLSVAAKETVVIIGPSGSGKSTLLRAINLLEPVDSGNVFFEGAEYHARTEEGASAPQRDRNGVPEFRAVLRISRQPRTSCSRRSRFSA